MNDNNGMRLEKFFHRVVVGVSAALILYGVVLAGTMIYGARQVQTPPVDAEFLELIAEQNDAEQAFPQMHPVPEFGHQAGEPLPGEPDIKASGDQPSEPILPASGSDQQGQAGEQGAPEAAP